MNKSLSHSNATHKLIIKITNEQKLVQVGTSRDNSKVTRLEKYLEDTLLGLKISPIFNTSSTPLNKGICRSNNYTKQILPSSLRGCHPERPLQRNSESSFYLFRTFLRQASKTFFGDQQIATMITVVDHTLSCHTGRCRRARKTLTKRAEERGSSLPYILVWK